MKVKPIDALIDSMNSKFKEDPTLENKVRMKLKKVVHGTYSDAIAQTTGYCMTLKVFESEVLSINALLGFNVQTDIKNSFVEQWDVPANAYMVGNPYYHTLILLVIYGLRSNKTDICENATYLILTKIWNGRRTHYIPYCNADIMRYAISQLSGKYLARSYDSPISLVMKHFTPSLLKTYGEEIKRDSTRSKRFFDQCYGRLRQVFVQNMAPDIKTGKSKARSGLAVAYYNSHEQGLKISKPQISTGDDGVVDQTEFYSSSDYDQIIDNLTHYITVNSHPTYPEQFLTFLRNESTVNVESIKMILNTMHNTKYYDFIRDILQLSLKQLQIQNRSEVCAPNFLTQTIRQRLISSKHAVNIVRLKKVVDLLLQSIYAAEFSYVDYTSYSAPRQTHLRKIILYSIGFNMQRYLCQQNN